MVRSQRKMLSSSWIIRVYGKLEVELPKDRMRFSVFTYTTWIDYLRDCTNENTSLMIYDARQASIQSHVERRRLKRLSQIFKEKGILWAYCEADNLCTEESTHAFLEGCLLRYNSSTIEKAQLMIFNAYDISTYAERMLFNGHLVEDTLERKAIQDIHRVWRQEYASLWKSINESSGLSTLQLTQMVIRHLNCALRNSIEAAEAHDLNFQQLNEVFLMYGRLDIFHSLERTFNKWMKASRMKLKA